MHISVIVVYGLFTLEDKKCKVDYLEWKHHGFRDVVMESNLMIIQKKVWSLCEKQKLIEETQFNDGVNKNMEA